MADDPAPSLATTLVKTLLTSLASSIGSRAGGAVAGWALNSLLGTEDQSAKLDALRSQLTELSAQLAAVDRDIKSAKLEILAEVERTNYESGVRSLDAPIGVITAHRETYVRLLAMAPSPSRESLAKDLARQVLDDVPAALETIHQILVGGGGDEGLLALWCRMFLNKTIMVEPRYTELSAPLKYFAVPQAVGVLLLIEASHTQNPPDSESAKAHFQELTGNYAAQTSKVPTYVFGYREEENGPSSTDPRPPYRILTDSRTGLMWTRDVARGYTWYFAHDAVHALDLGGHTDWRMPELVEVKSLLNGWKDTWPALEGKARCMHEWLTAVGFTGVDEPEPPFVPSPGTGSPAWFWTDHNWGPADWYHLCGSIRIYDNEFFDNESLKDCEPGVNFWAVRGDLPTGTSIE